VIPVIFTLLVKRLLLSLLKYAMTFFECLLALLNELLELVSSC
jgi:hypothetical protein